jgi:hypothetical protein
MAKSSPSNDKIKSKKNELRTASTITVPGHKKPAANDPKFEKQAQKDSETFIIIFLNSITTDDVHKVVEIFTLLFPGMQVAIENISIRDTDTNILYSLLGLAKKFNAVKIAAFLMSEGLTQDYVNDLEI